MIPTYQLTKKYVESFLMRREKVILEDEYRQKNHQKSAHSDSLDFTFLFLRETIKKTIMHLREVSGTKYVSEGSFSSSEKSRE